MLTYAGTEDILKLIFQNATAALYGDATGLLGSVVPGNVYLSLLTAQPNNITADQLTSEVTLGAYPTYARVAVPRSAAKWLFTAPNRIANIDAITWPSCTGGTSGTVTHYGIGTEATGAGILMYMGRIALPLVVTPGKIPTIAPGQLLVFGS